VVRRGHFEGLVGIIFMIGRARYTTNGLPGCPNKGGLLSGTGKGDLLSGRKGADELRGLGGSDELHGGYGSDVIYWSRATRELRPSGVAGGYPSCASSPASLPNLLALTLARRRGRDGL
jgi:hypothetical protein